MADVSHGNMNPNNSAYDNLLFRKAVDWSLLHYGITIPQKRLDAFFVALGQRVDVSNPSANVMISFNDKVFRVKVYLNGQATQIRWTKRDDIAVELRLIFADSYERFKVERNSKSGITMGLGATKLKEYIDVVAGGQLGTLMFLMQDSEIRTLRPGASEMPRGNGEQEGNPKTAKINKETSNKLQSVLASRYSSGFRLNSPIELVRFRKFYAGDVNEKILLSDSDLIKSITACGTLFDGKVYTVSEEAKIRIRKIVDGCFADGVQIIFYAAFYAKNESWLFDSSVVSEDMFIGILRGLYPSLWFTQTYFGHTNASVFSALESEILRVWGDDMLLTYEQLAERLPYIPFERIKYALGQNRDFIWNSAETFSHIGRIDIGDEARHRISDAATRECDAHGYVSITGLPYKEIVEQNHDLSVTAIHNAVFRLCLADKFDKKGKIITRKGDVFDAFTIMKEYCRTIEKCSLDDLLDFEKELTGEVHRRIPMEAGNIILVRIDKNAYVADKYVRFDVASVDVAIELFMSGEYMPLKSFTTFGAFPDCGQTWNLFLLESYCRRFSREFRFDTPSVNSRNAGTVIRKSCGLNYTEIMTDAVANSDIPLTASAIGRFLYENGYTGRGSTAKSNEIISKATIIREGRG